MKHCLLFSLQVSIMALFLSTKCASTKPAVIQVFNPTFERARDQVDPVLFSMNSPADQVIMAADIGHVVFHDRVYTPGQGRASEGVATGVGILSPERKVCRKQGHKSQGDDYFTHNVNSSNTSLIKQ